MKNGYLCILLMAWTLSGFSASAFANEGAPLKQEQLAASLREKLAPSIESALRVHCGEDCPSFRIDPQFKKAAVDAQMDDLGFSNPSEPDVGPELQSVSVSVLIQDRVSKKSRESLRKILAHQITNEANVPVSVRVLPLDAFGPLLEKRMHADAASLSLGDKIDLVKASVWPICLLLLAGVAFFGLLLILRHRKEVLRAKLASKKSFLKRDASESVASAIESEPSLASEMLKKRSEDLHWLIEDAAKRSDLSTLRKTLSLFQAHELTSQIQFSRETLSVLASLNDLPSEKNADEKWLLPVLAQAHWRRMEEQADRLARIKRLTSARAVKTFSKLRSMGARAAFVASLPEDRWPELLATLSSGGRVTLGLNLADYAEATAEARATLCNQLTQELDQMDEALLNRSTEVLEAFTLYLSEKEGQRLWQDLSLRSMAATSTSKRSPKSIDSILSGLEASAATEICTRLDIGTLSVVLAQVSGETRAQIYQCLPKSLQARLDSASTKLAGEAEEMKARAALIETYREFVAGSVVQ